MCVNGTFVDVCNETLTIDQARMLCMAIDSRFTVGYPYPLYTNGEPISYDANAFGIYNFACPSGFGYLDVSSCSFNITSGNGCSSYGGPAVITCVAGKWLLFVVCVWWIILYIAPTGPQNCTNNDNLILSDRGFGYFNNGTYFVIGRPQYCQGGSYIPFCTSLDQNDATTFCAYDRSAYGKCSVDYLVKHALLI